MRNKLFTILLAVSITAMYSFGTIATVFADGTDQSVPSITLDKTEMSLTAGGDAGKITATANPADAAVTWSSSSDTVVSVNNGTVTPVAAGTATITAKETVDGTDYTATATVTVAEAQTAAPKTAAVPVSKAPAKAPAKAPVELKNVAVINDDVSVTYDTIVKAVDKAKDGDKIKVYGTVLWGGESQESTKSVTITSGSKEEQGHVVLNGANKYSFPTNHGNDDTPNVTNFNCATTLDNVYVEQSAGINFLFANGHKLVINSNVTMKSNGSVCSGETSGSNMIAVGGSYQKAVASADMTLNAGSYEYVIGGGLGKDVTGSVKLTIGAFSDGVLGGGYRADIGGGTDVTVNGNVGVLGGVYGGCYEGTVSGSTAVAVNGKLGTSGYSIVAGGSCYKGAVAGNTSVTIGANGNVGSAVYGGNSGTVNDPNPLGAGNNQRYSQKANEQTLYPAARTISKSFVGGDTKVTVEAGGVCNEAVYGGGADTPVNGSTHVTINGTVYGDRNAEGVYGGGAYVGADILGNTSVEIGKTASIPRTLFTGGTYPQMLGGNVFGGGRFGSVEGNVNITLNGRVGSNELGGSVFGGGFRMGGKPYTQGDVKGKIKIIVNAAPYAYTAAADNNGWQNFGKYKEYCNISGVYGAGVNNITDGSTEIDVNTDMENTPLFGDSLGGMINGDSTININAGGKVNKVYGWYSEGDKDTGNHEVLGGHGTINFKGNKSNAVQVINADLVKVTDGSDVTIDNNKADNDQLVNVKDLTIDKSGKLTLKASARISGDYNGDGTGTLAVPAIAVGANSDKGRLAVGGTVTGNTNISITDADSVVPAENQVYVTSKKSTADSAANYKWVDQRNKVAMGYKAVSNQDENTSAWYLVKYEEPVVPPVTPTTPTNTGTTVETVTDNNTANTGGATDKAENNNTNKASGTTTVKPVNNNASAPKTGDPSDMMTWMLLGAAGIALAGIAVKMRKREED